MEDKNIVPSKIIEIETSIKYTQELLSNGVGVYFLNDNINTILPDSELRLTLMSSIVQD